MKNGENSVILYGIQCKTNKMKKWLRFWGILGVITWTSLQVMGQDAQFSQFYAAPTYHNPAFAGGTFSPRLIANYRNQWPALDANFVTSSFSFDHHFDKINSGVGITVLNDLQGVNLLRHSEIALQYSYLVRVADETYLRLGGQAAYANRGLSTSGLIFGDQIGNDGITNPSSSDPFFRNYFPVNYADFSTGAVVYNQRAWFGLSGHHLGRPNISLTPDGDARLPVRYTATGGVNIPLNNAYSGASLANRDFTATGAFLFRKQGAFTQLDLGTYLTYAPITAGIWYRGIPIRRSGNTLLNNDAVIAMVGYRMENFSIGYSYDITISRLRGTTGGAHELSIAYQFDRLQPNIPFYKKRRKQEMACPKF